MEVSEKNLQSCVENATTFPLRQQDGSVFSHLWLLTEHQNLNMYITSKADTVTINTYEAVQAKISVSEYVLFSRSEGR